MAKKLYSVDVTIVGTAYIKAETADGAMALASHALRGAAAEADDCILFDGRSFKDLMADNRMAFNVTLSPAMTVGDFLAASIDVAYDPEEED